MFTVSARHSSKAVRFRFHSASRAVTVKMCNASENKVVLDFSQLNTRPGPSAVKKLVAELGLKPENLRALINCRNRNAVILEFASAEEAAKTVARQLHYQGNKIPVYIDNEAIEVRVYDLHTYVSNDAIAEALSQFGEVLTIVNDRWKNFFPGLLNGVRLVKMKMSIQPVPKHIMVSNSLATIMYKGQKSACRLAQKKTHADKASKAKPKTDANKISKNNLQQKQQKDSNHREPTSSNKNGANDSKNNNNEEEEQPQPEIEQDAEGFELVRTKHDRKTLKRQHSEGKETPAKLPGHQRADFFGRKWLGARRKSEEAVDAVSKQLAERLKTMYKEKFQECYFKLPKVEKEQVTVFQDITDVDFYSD